MRLARVLLAVSISALAALPVASCSLGLDESLIGRTDAAASDAPTTDETAPPDGGGDVTPPPPPGPDAGPCTKDDDCKTNDPCLEPRCDLPRKACAFDVCRTAVCTSGKCDTTNKTCTSPKPYKFAAASFPVGAGVAGAVRSAFAVVYPYVFVDTANGVLAFSAADPAATSPTPVTVTGLGFVPNQIVASGSRVFFLGGNSGSTTTTRVQLAWIDVPSDPYRKQLSVTTVLPTLNRPSGAPLALFPRANDTALLVDFTGAPGTNFPSAKVEPPLTEPVTLTAGALPITAGDAPVTTSGTRVVMHRTDAANQPQFGFILGAGDTPTSQPDAPATAFAPVAGPEVFAASPLGTVLWVFQEFAPGIPAPPPPIPPSYKGVKASFVVADATSPFDLTAAAAAEIATYPGAGAPIGSTLAGGAALVDAKTAVVTTADPANLGGLSNVQVLARQPLGLVAGKKAQIPIGVGALAAASSNGLAYVLAAENATASTVYVFDPGCGP